MARRMTGAAAAITALVLLMGAGCTEDKKNPYAWVQYRVNYLGSSDDVTMIGNISRSGNEDWWGFCSASDRGDHLLINIGVSDRQVNPNEEVRFVGLQWPEGSTGSVVCDHVEITHETDGNDAIPCGGGEEGTCQVQVAEDPDEKHTVIVAFTCNNFETRTSSGGVPNTMDVYGVPPNTEGVLRIKDCGGF